jgi:hypothetical protein
MNDFLNIATSFGADKCTQHGYHFFYPQHIEHLREKQFNLLEIGFDGGNSARFWRQYFPQAKLHFLDIKHSDQQGDWVLFTGDQSNINDLESLSKAIGSCELIIDDGSHVPTHQWESFVYLFNHLLTPGGTYIIEDIECNWWNADATIYGYKIGYFNFVEKSKSMVEMINAEFSGKKNYLKISSITYGQNCIIIKKQTEEESNYFNSTKLCSRFL